MRNDTVERAEFQQPFHRSFGAHLGHARHVVHRITDQRLVVHHQVRRHTKLGLYSGQVAALVVHGVNHGDVLVHQLAQVLVSTGNHHLNALSRRQAGQRADHIVGLHARHIQHRPAHQAHHLVHRINLAAQIRRHGGTVGLVSGVQVVPEGRALGVKHTGGVVGPHIAAQLLHHVDHAADGAGGRTGRVGRVSAQIRQRVERAVQVAGAVHQQQRFFVGANQGGGRS